MKKILCLVLALCMLMALCACGNTAKPSETQKPTESKPAETQPTETKPVETEPAETKPAETEPAETEPAETEPEETEPEVVLPAPEGPTGLDYASEVTAFEGDWTLTKVYIDEDEYDAVADAMTFKIKLELDPSELVDGPAYIHNQVYNMSAFLTFGVQDVVDELEADDVESYKGTTSWEDFPQGKVVEEGQFYKQPGPATMRFKDIDDYGLFLDKVAGITDDIDTTNKNLIIGFNGEGQLLLGYSEVHLERPGNTGAWEYCLVFDKA